MIERTIGNRVHAEVEWSGLDPLEMGSEAYPQRLKPVATAEAREDRSRAAA